MARGAMVRKPTGKPEVLTRDECAALGQRILGLISGPWASVAVGSGMTASTSFARGDAHLTSEGGGSSVSIIVNGCRVRTNRLDDAGLRMAIAQAEAAAREVRGAVPAGDLLGPQEYATPPKLFYESVEAAMTAEARAELCRQALDATEAAGLIGAGDLTFSVSSQLQMNTAGLFAYTHQSYGVISLTARTPDGTGSGWASSGYEDWSRVNPEAVIARALDLAQRSAKPVAVEPGRYTVILEPPAVAALLDFDWDAYRADQGITVFSKDPRGTNKIGLQMMDRRLGVLADPWDPEMPQSTVGSGGEPARKVVWFDQGILQDLRYSRSYAQRKNREPVVAPSGFRLAAEGPTQTLEEMIASTKRGIWVNRLSHVTRMNGRTLLLSGTTRDGTFLIENGKITKAIKNFRFTESPFFVFNKLEAWGEPVRASGSRVAPRLKVRDFDFTSLTEAV